MPVSDRTRSLGRIKEILATQGLLQEHRRFLKEDVPRREPACGSGRDRHAS